MIYLPTTHTKQKLCEVNPEPYWIMVPHVEVSGQLKVLCFSHFLEYINKDPRPEISLRHAGCNGLPQQSLPAYAEKYGILS